MFVLEEQSLDKRTIITKFYCLVLSLYIQKAEADLSDEFLDFFNM